MLVSVTLAVMFVGTVWLALVRAPSCDRREEAGASLALISGFLWLVGSLIPLRRGGVWSEVGLGINALAAVAAFGAAAYLTSDAALTRLLSVAPGCPSE